MSLFICILVFAIICSTSATDICSDWNRIIDTLYILENNSTGKDNEPIVTSLTACPVPHPLADLQKAKNYAYWMLEGTQSCSLEEFARLLREGGWDQPMWLMRYNGGIYNQTIATITMVDGKPWGVRVNFPERISGLNKSIAGDGWLDATGNVVVKNTVENITDRRLFAS